MVSSLSGLIGLPFDGAYAASKFALEGASESLRYELEPFGVKVALVEPGAYATALAVPHAGAAETAYDQFERCGARAQAKVRTVQIRRGGTDHRGNLAPADAGAARALRRAGARGHRSGCALSRARRDAILRSLPQASAPGARGQP